MKYIFLHIEKTAGTSLVSYIKNSVGRDCFYYTRPDLLNDKQIVENKLNKYTALAGHMRYDQIIRNFNDIFKITFLRNPIDRIVSFYYYAKESPETKDKITIMSKSLSMIDFLQFCKDENERRFVNGMTFKLASSHFPDSELLSARRNLASIDFIGLQESFTESMHMLSYQTGWNPIAITPNINKTKKKDSKDQLDSKIIDKILELNGDDLKIYEEADKRFKSMRENILYNCALKKI